MNYLAVAVAAPAAAAAFFLLRLLPIWKVRSRGCDAYNILLCAEAVRRTKRIPPRIDGLFLLEEPEQWYPPVFFVVAALLPQKWLNEKFWLVNQCVDLLNAALLLGIVSVLVGPVLGAAVVVGYAMVAGLVQEFAALNTRPLGLLVVNLVLVTGYLATQDVRWIPVVLFCGVVLVYSHKLSAQLVWFALPVLALVTCDLRWLALLPAIYLAAFLVWPRGFRRLMQSHFAIVRFWHRNWPWLGAHAVRQSPIYGDSVTCDEFYYKWRTGTEFAYFKQMLHQNYFVVPALFGSALSGVREPWLLFLVGWIASVYIAACAVHFIRQLRAIGLGQQYVKFALFPSILATALMMSSERTSLAFLVVVAGAVVLTIRQYVLVAVQLKNTELDSSGLRTPEFERVLIELAKDNRARILVLPVQLCDLVAYTTRRPVYWGTHAQIFDQRLEAFFPVLRRSLSEYARDARLTTLLLDTRYAKVEELGIADHSVFAESGPFVLVSLNTLESPSVAVQGEAVL
jgi:hypothetical protein